MSPDVSEADFQRAVIDLAKLRGWRVWHDNDSRRNAAGLPDLILVRKGALIFAELKSQKGHLRPAQSDWLSDLAAVGSITRGRVQALVWRPADMPMIQELLK